MVSQKLSKLLRDIEHQPKKNTKPSRRACGRLVIEKRFWNISSSPLKPDRRLPDESYRKLSVSWNRLVSPYNSSGHI